MHTSNVFYNEPAAALASLIVTLTQREGGLGYPAGAQHPTGVPGAKVFFSNSGTEANEGALKVARKVGKDRGGSTKTEIVCFKQSFHGRSFGALSVTSTSKYQDPFRPLVPGVRVGELNESEGLEDLITENTCAVIVEPIQGEGGVNGAEIEWMRKLVQRARDTGAVVIFDEIQVSTTGTRSYCSEDAPMASFEFVRFPSLFGSETHPARFPKLHYSLYAHSAGFTELEPYGHILRGRWTATPTS